MLQKTRLELLAESKWLILPPSDRQQWQSPTEWLETNGLGGWSSSSVMGSHTRRYHGLLVAATKPPTERMNLLSKLDETIVLEGERFELSCNNYNDVISPTGYKYISSFQKGLFPEWLYEFAGLKLRKAIIMLHGENTTVIKYEVLDADRPFEMELLPLISAKGYHSLQHDYNNIWWDVAFEEGIFRNKPFDQAPDIYVSVPGASYQHQPRWFTNFNYVVEKYRGQDYGEDLFNHGIIRVELKKGDVLGIIISTNDPAERDAIALFDTEKRRREKLLSKPFDASISQLLSLAADQFIVKRGEDLKTVIAGYHWFTDWGRDTMISLPGLCLSTGRFEDAKKILAAFANSISMGMLPNRFRDDNEPPEYNNVDGTLWYFIAVKKYWQATADLEFLLGNILPGLKEIIDWHFRGTRFNIHVDPDGLLYAGENGQQLTWMDARIGDWVVTPRMGKPVEIQALWYNALKIFAELLVANKQDQDADLVELSAHKVKENFKRIYWNDAAECLYDVIHPDGEPDSSIRPNQLFAISLPFPLINGREAASVLGIVRHELYTPVGLRSLAAADKQYIPYYGGNAFERDSSYHQGTVWSWLLGPYIDAIMTVKEAGYLEQARAVIESFQYHLKEGDIGSISEIFDAEPPHHPRGCVAQAWSVAEIYRVIREYDLV